MSYLERGTVSKTMPERLRTAVAVPTGIELVRIEWISFLQGQVPAWALELI